MERVGRGEFEEGREIGSRRCIGTATIQAEQGVRGFRDRQR